MHSDKRKRQGNSQDEEDKRSKSSEEDGVRVDSPATDSPDEAEVEEFYAIIRRLHPRSDAVHEPKVMEKGSSSRPLVDEAGEAKENEKKEEGGEEKLPFDLNETPKME